MGLAAFNRMRKQQADKKAKEVKPSEAKVSKKQSKAKD